jgi:hypothetical protein
MPENADYVILLNHATAILTSNLPAAGRRPGYWYAAKSIGGQPWQFEREQRELFRIGRRSLAIGIFVLACCLTASQTLAPFIPNTTLARVIEESLIIVGWVANWRPLEIYLYDWWPIRRNIGLYRRIATATVTVTITDV